MRKRSKKSAKKTAKKALSMNEKRSGLTSEWLKAITLWRR